ncbi:MAG: hypothetical protein GY820_09970 [Gammaproteobacteria bacterium]|nr:hypothetical protein [Gammaproteobacteria bacterium]
MLGQNPPIICLQQIAALDACAKMKEQQSKYGEIVSRCQLEFSSVADYIWKSPRLIEAETKSELEKLKAYFPNDEELQKIRWKHESRKLERTFPYLIAVGNLFSTLSLFESYVLLVCEEIEKEGGSKVRDTKHSGISRLFVYLRQNGINLEDCEVFPQITAAIKIRNCMMHASGMLAWSRESTELKRIQRSGLYLSKTHRQHRKNSKGKFNELKIIDSGFGERLQVANEYPHVLSSYLQDFVIFLCNDAMQVEPIG